MMNKEEKTMSDEFVNALYNGKNLEAEDAFKSAMQDKVGAALEVKRKKLQITL